MGTFADTYSLRTALANFNGAANAVDGALSTRWGGTTGGVANAYTLTPNPAWTTSISSAIRYIVFTPHVTNTGATTLNISGTGVTAVQYKGSPLVGGELVANVEAIAVFDGTVFELLTHGGGWATWTPTYSANLSMTYTAVTTQVAQYQRHGSRVDFRINAVGTTGGTAGSGLRFTAPINLSGVTSGFGGYVVDGTAEPAAYGFFVTSSIIEVRKFDASNYGLGTNRTIGIGGSYAV